MTTDLTQLHPHKDFSEHKPAKGPVVWLAVGVGALLASGAAAFMAMRPVTPPPLPAAGVVSPLTELAANESAETERAVFGEDAEDSEATEIAQVAGGSASPPPSTEPHAADPGAPVGALAAGSAEEGLGTTDTEPGEVAASIEPASAGAYYVQLASYHAKEPADAQAADLEARGFKAQSAAYGGPEAGWWHAVRLGPFKERAEAEKQRFDLPVHERRSAYVLPRSNGKFHVQVASFAEREEAEQVAKTFRAQGHATKVTRVKMSGTYWFCVRIGPFDTRDEATAYKALVADIPGSESTVIPFAPPPAVATR